MSECIKMNHQLSCCFFLKLSYNYADEDNLSLLNSAQIILPTASATATKTTTRKSATTAETTATAATAVW
jgi:hypothetical protein